MSPQNSDVPGAFRFPSQTLTSPVNQADVAKPPLPGNIASVRHDETSSLQSEEDVRKKQKTKAKISDVNMTTVDVTLQFDSEELDSMSVSERMEHIESDEIEVSDDELQLIENASW